MRMVLLCIYQIKMFATIKLFIFYTFYTLKNGYF